ncbi:hypothetical protein PF005_g29198 [Phytophthora fragariae]|uniref:Uncharacterized protein n=2 Tax=Phytophthora TaxID=4783 RepID=A0A6A3PWT4_9STRA|nr:hypothetical protein PF009_g29634 [Phytophthora fragariae]KAE8975600.1 hypothetical protein PR002_g25565 [Phytophthora rubi]KAE8965543.1 hypothetical protein PF011_g28251 [Phytophthora fragariae]KAE9063967.1 hypothetical protein PF010_g28791 [Phytophthora fragariae]KAE9064856.1 hypothetical protein PF007_g29046 [Phytophthora fragariae]
MSHSEAGADAPPDSPATEATSWTYVKDFDVRLRVNDVEELLLHEARAEAMVVSNRIHQRIFGALSPRPPRVSVADLLQLWLNDSILTGMTQFINLSLPQTSFVTKDELLSLVEVELWLCFYSDPNRFLR